MRFFPKIVSNSPKVFKVITIAFALSKANSLNFVLKFLMAVSFWVSARLCEIMSYLLVWSKGRHLRSAGGDHSLKMKLFKRRLSFSGDKQKRVSHTNDPFEHEVPRSTPPDNISPACSKILYFTFIKTASVYCTLLLYHIVPIESV